MANAPPGHYTCRSFEFTDVVRILDINATTLTGWLNFAKMLRPFGDKIGHRRIYSQIEVYTLALLATLSGAGVPVGERIILSRPLPRPQFQIFNFRFSIPNRNMPPLQPPENHQ